MKDAWLVLGVESQAPWCTKETEWTYDGRDIIARPPRRTKNGPCLPDVRLYCAQDAEVDQALETIRRFFSSLCWRHRRPVEERDHFFANPPISHGGQLRYAPIYGDPSTDWPHESPPGAQQRLAQALYREAVSINAVPYQFLGLFKILEVAAPTAGGRKRLIRRAVASLDQERRTFPVEQAIKRRDELLRLGEAPQDWLYESCRCAVAHAASSPVIDPDSAKDTFRLSQDVVLMRYIAEQAMVHELGM